MFDSTSAVLREYYNLVGQEMAVKYGEQEADEVFNEASEIAIGLLVNLGNEDTTPDKLGDEISNNVQTLLHVLIARCPRLKGLFEYLDANPELFDNLRFDDGT